MEVGTELVFQVRHINRPYMAIIARFADAGVPLYIQAVYTLSMAITKVFRSGNSQAVRIPRAFQLDVDEVEILRRGEDLLLRKRRKNLGEAYHLIAGLSSDFLKGGRKQAKAQKRPAL